MYVACYDFILGFNVSSSVLMIFQLGGSDDGGIVVAVRVLCLCLGGWLLHNIFCQNIMS